MVGYNLEIEMISRSWIGEIHPADCQMTAADVVVVITDVAAIAMIGNNVVWIHRLIKHCLQSWTDKFGHFYALVWEMTCSMMQVKQRGREPWVQSGKRSRDQNFENIVMDSCANFRECPFVAFHTRSRKPRRSGIHSIKFSKWGIPGTMRTLTRFTNPN